MKIKLTSVYVDDQDKALRFYTDVLGFAKKADITNGPYRWLTVASPEDPDGTELQLAPTVTRRPRRTSKRCSSTASRRSCSSPTTSSATTSASRRAAPSSRCRPTAVTNSTIAQLKDTCGNLVQITELARW